jgi:hypothetical protein
VAAELCVEGPMLSLLLRRRGWAWEALLWLLVLEPARVIGG